jgi:hypothetical protein
MKIGQKITVLFPVPRPHDEREPETKFLRCYVMRRVSNGWQLYDPVRDWSWGLKEGQDKERVVVG